MAKSVYGIPGTNIKRTTDRVYTHAIVAIQDGKPSGVHCFCGSAERAAKALADVKRRFPGASVIAAKVEKLK